MNDRGNGKPFLIIAGAVGLLIFLSLFPWGELTGNRLKDFNLLSDIFPDEPTMGYGEYLDPELSEALRAKETKKNDNTDTVSGPSIEPPKVFKNIAEDGTVLIEDYSPGGKGFANLRKALGRTDRTARVGVIGDSYIEGDIMTMNLRENLQNRFGGKGIGYVPAFTELTGFRTSVKQSCDGWIRHEIRTDAPDDKKILQGEYYSSNGSGNSRFKGVSSPARLDSWDRTSVVCLAPGGGEITLSTDSSTQTFPLDASNIVRSFSLNGSTSSASIKASVGVNVMGVYLDGNTGVAVDNMSLRGYSGRTHRNLSKERAREIREFIDYDLIIVEYGTNALSTQQKEYGGYSEILKGVINRIKECYPNSDILLLGIGDRGQKSGTDVKSIPTATNMVDAQRKAARDAGVMFWDTRQAMGGENSVVAWREKGMINPDYVHLNSKGGKEIARLLTNAIIRKLQ